MLPAGRRRAQLRSGQPDRSAHPPYKRNAPGEPGRLMSRSEFTRRYDPFGLISGVVALGVPFVDDIVDLFDVALGVELHLAITVSTASLIVSITFFDRLFCFATACDQTCIRVGVRACSLSGIMFLLETRDDGLCGSAVFVDRR